MLTTIIASAIVLATSALAQTPGNAIVVNNCQYDVHLSNTPAAGGGGQEVDQVLSPGDKYSQQYTQLSNGNGWSLKLSKDASLSNIMQYEYTWHGWDGAYGGMIWFDLSDVNGNPWNGNWEITATGDCSPKQSAYRFSTDDAYGMQSCPGESDVTVTLCSGSSGSSSSPPESSSDGGLLGGVTSLLGGASPSTESAPAPTTSSTGFGGFGFGDPLSSFGNNVIGEKLVDEPKGGKGKSDGHKGKNKSPAVQQPSPTTMATLVSTLPDRGGVTVTEVATEVVTNFVTATAAAPKRHEHHPRHQHHQH